MSATCRVHAILWRTVAAAAAWLAAGGGAAQAAAALGEIVTPPSGVEKPADVGLRAHTNVEVFVPAGGLGPGGPQPFSGYLIETPASLACAYSLVTPIPGCNPYKVTRNPTGGSNAIAIVDAYDYAAAKDDLTVFSKTFGLSAANLTVVYGTGNPSDGCKSGAQPSSASRTGWDLEAATDIEWAHAMAPSAKLYLVEAKTNLLTDMLNAVGVATACVQKSTKGQISNSWGTAEFSGEPAYDGTFTGAGVVYFFRRRRYFRNREFAGSVVPGRLPERRRRGRHHIQPQPNHWKLPEPSRLERQLSAGRDSDRDRRRSQRL